MPETVEIGLGRSARRGYHLDDIALVPTRRTRGQGVVSMAWQIDAHAFDLWDKLAESVDRAKEDLPAAERKALDRRIALQLDW